MAILHQLVEDVRWASGFWQRTFHHHLIRKFQDTWDYIQNVWKLITFTCSESSGVEIIPPQRVTRALGNELDHLSTSSLSIWSAIARMAGFETRIALMKSLIRFSSRFSSLIVRFWSVISVLSSASFCCCPWQSVRNSRTQLWFLNSSFGIMNPQPFSHGKGRLGLCSHSSRWAWRASSLRIAWQP